MCTSRQRVVNIIEIDAGCVWNTGPSEVQEFFRAGKFSKDCNMFLKAEPTCAHHDNVSIKANIIEIDAGCVWNTEPSEVQGIFQSRKVL